MAKGAAFAVIDVGSAKIATIVGDISERDTLRVLGVGVAPSTGVEKGQISNIAKASAAIQTAVEKAERSSGTRILSAAVVLSGAHLSSLNNRGIVAIPDPGQPIGGDDIQRVIDAARTISLKSNREMLHALPRYFVVDGQDRVSDPEGMHGQRLDVEMHLVTGAVSNIQNLTKCVENAGVQVDALLAGPVVASAAVLQPEEMQEGAVHLDIGGGSTDIAIYQEGSIVHTASLPIGGVNVTRDLVVGLRCPFQIAEETKTQYASALVADAGNEEIHLTAFGQEPEREFSRQLIAEIVQARVEEIVTMALLEVKRAGQADAISAGIIVTGGTADLPGITRLIEELTTLPARVGAVDEVYGLVDQISTPGFASTLGALRWMTDGFESAGQPLRLSMPKAPGVLDLFRSMGRIGRVFLPQ
jgi:cell division protein FtsA